MKDNNTFAIIGLIAVTAFLSFLVIRSNGKLNEALRAVNSVKEELSVVKDSIRSAQTSISVVIDKFEFAETELMIMKTDRELLELDFKRKRAADWDELQYLKDEISKREETRNKLISQAKNIEL